MASPSVDYLNSMWQYLPQGHEKPLKQAFFNTIANIFLFLGCAVFGAVYFVLSPFLRPLSWALLCGTFLYPFKRSLTNTLRNWLKGLDSSGTPFAIGIIILPFQVANSAAETLTQAMLENLKLILGVVFGIPLAYIVYSLGILGNVLYIVQFVFAILYELTGFFSSFWMWTLFIGYLVGVMFVWKPESPRDHWLKKVSIPIWVAMVVHFASVAGSLRVPVLLLLVIVLSVGFCVELCQTKKTQSADPDSPGTPMYMSILYTVLGCSNTTTTGPDTSSSNAADPKQEDRGMADESERELPMERNSKVSDIIEEAPPPMAQSTPLTAASKPLTLPLKTKTDHQGHYSSPPTRRMSSMTPKEPPASASETRQFFWGLLIAHIVVRLWMQFWIIVLLILLPVVHTGLKWLWTRFCSDGKLKKQLQESKVASFFEQRKDMLMPRSLRGVFYVLRKGDSKIVRTLASGLDSATSILFILMLLVGTVIFSLVAAVQIQTESMYMIKSTQDVLNKTMNSEFSQWMPDAELMVTTMDQVVQKTHEYGRNFIASKVRDFVDTDKTEEQDNLVNQVLEVWDRVYDAWKDKNNNVTTVEGKAGSPSLLPDFKDMDTLWQTVSQGGGLFNVNAIVAFVKENLGTFMSVMESLWTVLKGNMSLVVTVLTSILSALLGGGTAILNFLISAVIFLTTLFYLLASSGDVYKPAAYFSSMSPGSNKFGNAVEEAISGVFMASLKMAAFYGGYTWLVHIVFGLDIVFIPSALAAIFAAIPFLGPYWASLPAVIELWLVQGRGLAALLLFLAHMLPSSLVDAKIYSEIKGGHPYITGLAIAGGMYWLGLEGALIGPMILCGLIVFVNIYRAMLKNEPATPGPANGPSRSRERGIPAYGDGPNNNNNSSIINNNNNIAKKKKKRIAFTS